MTAIGPARISARLVFVLALAAEATMARVAAAATFCVHTSTQLQNAMTAAESNGQDDVIKVEEGTYTAPATTTNSFDYEAYAEKGDDDYDLEISGGWYAAFNVACLGHHNTPFQTVLAGNGSGRVMTLGARAHSNVVVRFLSFSGGDAGSGYGGGLSLYASESGDAATWTIERNVFIANTAGFGGGLEATMDAAGAARIRIINNLFLSNHATGNAGAAEVGNIDSDGIYVTNNTVLSNTADNTGTHPAGGMYIFGTGTLKYVANNNFWNNDANDLYVADQDFSLLHNNYHTRGGSVPTQSAGNISVEPQYQPGLFNYTPVRNSPLVDAGVNPALFASWYLTSTDLRGHDRTVGAVDIGAYEEDVIFADGYETSVF